MATVKKTPIKKKKSTAKAASSKKFLRPWNWRFSIVTVGVFIIAVGAVIVISLYTARAFNLHTTETRLDRINAIYQSLNLGESYQITRTNVFGDKRVYEWDKGRTYSSEIDYLHGDTVGNTVAELDTKIKAAGFAFVDEPYPGSKQVQYHYESNRGEYIRLTVSSKPYDDAFRNALAMNQSTADALKSLDANAGPSNVIIKVNLDDNNE